MTLFASKSMPHALKSVGRLELEGIGGMPGMVGVWSKYAYGSTKAMSFPPRSTNWSSAYSCSGGMSFGWTSSRTLMSLSISFAVSGTSFTSNSRLSSVASTQGSELCRV